jgi:hypothetical protein
MDVPCGNVTPEQTVPLGVPDRAFGNTEPFFDKEINR